MQKLKIFTSMLFLRNLSEDVFTQNKRKENKKRWNPGNGKSKDPIDQIILKLVLSYWF